MRGVGGPLLCIGDLLSDVGDDDAGEGSLHESPPPPSTPATAISGQDLHPSDLHHLFEESYNQLVQSLTGTDHSWTALTLKLCAALKSADKLVNSANSNISAVLEKIRELESIISRSDSAVEAVKFLNCMLADKAESSTNTSNGTNIL